MTRRELYQLYERLIGRDGPECPECGGTLTENLGAARYICWMCGREFIEGETGDPLVAEKMEAA